MNARRLVLSVLVGVLVTPASVTAGGRNYVSHNCTGVKVRPNQIMFACADGGFYVNHLQWSKWGRWQARARGTYHMNDCNPSCAGGMFHTRKGRITLSEPRRCPEIDKRVFRHAEVRFAEPWRGHTKESHKLFCPF